MDFDTLVSAARSVDANNSVLIFILCATATYLIRELFQPPVWIPLITFPVMLVASYAGVAIFKVSGVFPTADTAMNTVISAVVSITACFAAGALLYRAVAEVSDKSNYGPYKSKDGKPVDRTHWHTNPH